MNESQETNGKMMLSGRVSAGEGESEAVRMHPLLPLSSSLYDEDSCLSVRQGTHGGCRLVTEQQLPLCSC